MKAVILAAGVSRRLYPLTYNTPKCLIELGGKSILNHQLDSLIESGINDVTFIVGYQREVIIKHVETHYPSLDSHFI